MGRWADDYLFVVETNGFYDDRTWLDNAGLPQSDAMQVEETYHRVDANHLELSIKITDPKMYTKPWIALDKLPLRLQSPISKSRKWSVRPRSRNAGVSILVTKPDPPVAPKTPNKPLR